MSTNKGFSAPLCASSLSVLCGSCWSVFDSFSISHLLWNLAVNNSSDMGQLVLKGRRGFLLIDLLKLKLMPVFQTLKHFNILQETGAIVILFAVISQSWSIEYWTTDLFWNKPGIHRFPYSRAYQNLPRMACCREVNVVWRVPVNRWTSSFSQISKDRSTRIRT